MTSTPQLDTQCSWDKRLPICHLHGDVVHRPTLRIVARAGIIFAIKAYSGRLAPMMQAFCLINRRSAGVSYTSVFGNVPPIMEQQRNLSGSQTHQHILRRCSRDEGDLMPRTIYEQAVNFCRAFAWTILDVRQSRSTGTEAFFPQSHIYVEPRHSASPTVRRIIFRKDYRVHA